MWATGPKWFRESMIDTAASDVEGSPVAANAAPRRKPGRPKGARGRVVRDPRALGVHHFAFVRSELLGLDLAEAFDRYLAWGEPTSDFRFVQNRCAALLKAMIEAGHQLNATLPPHEQFTDLLNTLRAERTHGRVVQIPTLEEWAEAEGMDPDFWSEAEMLAEYKTHFQLDALDTEREDEEARDQVRRRVKALNYLETVLAAVPTATDRLESWFAQPIVKCLRSVGIISLADLVVYINAYGYRWYSTIKGLGGQRATQLVAWLVLEQEHLKLAVQSHAHEPKSKVDLQVGVLLPPVTPNSPASRPYGENTVVATAIRRMEQAPALAGEQGVFRTHMANALGASNDLEAVAAWLKRYDEKPATSRSYRKEAERFLLWCAQELRKPLSSVTAVDCQAYRAFLKSVPTAWIQRRPLRRTDPAWRAFRGQPSPASQKQALVILQALFGGLVDAGYLVANPLRSLMKSFDLPAPKMNIQRSFTEAEWRYVLSRVQALPSGPERDRLQCILDLAVTSGIRLNELANLRRKHLRIESLPELPDTWVMSVTGKRNKTRDVPLNPEVVAQLAGHWAHFAQLDEDVQDKGGLPVIRALGPSVAQWALGEGGRAVAQPKTEQGGGALSAAGIYAALKRFFVEASKWAEAAGLDRARFETASTHWLRHTFVRQTLVDGTPVEVASEIVGHASIATTSIYATQELARKIRAIQGMRRRTVE